MAVLASSAPSQPSLDCFAQTSSAPVSNLTRSEMADSHNTTARIWRPPVALAHAAGVPRADEPEREPASAGHHQSAAIATSYNSTLTTSTRTYSKTSLVHQHHQPASGASTDVAAIAARNAEIRAACQSFNNSPKPFSLAGARRSSLEEPIVHARTSHDQPSKEASCGTRLVRSSTVPQPAEPGQASGPPVAQPASMAPKLVHKQYNSPLDLYSMSNIRKTIEAHSELLAPGLKGINFRKPETPVNKQSEVYKLVMEQEQEEGRRARQQPCVPAPALRCLAPAPGAPSPRAASVSPTSTSATAAEPARPAAAGLLGGQSQLQAQPPQPLPLSGAEQSGLAPPEPSQSAAPSAELAEPPICCSCGHFIVGPFAKLARNKCIHPHCFNCTTCGTSLKNTGYFTIKEKLYCDIHAKQVANLVQTRYIFAQQFGSPPSQPAPGGAPGQHQRQEAESPSSSISASHQFEHQPSLAGPMGAPSSSANPSPVTISTMFAGDQGRNQASASDKVVWTWRPATIRERVDGSSKSSATISVSSTSNNLTSASQCSTQQQTDTALRRPPMTPIQLPGTACFGQQQSMITMTGSAREQGVLRDSPLHGGRIPVCFNCSAQIRGPYILAGKTTWCKVCSQMHFNCSSCRRSLIDIGFIEGDQNIYYCEGCFEAYYAPTCSKCNLKIKGDCLNALGKQWHPSCFVCANCRRPFGNSSFYLEDNVPYCERDWNLLFTTKCCACSYPIEAGDKWVEALDRNYHSNCFTCATCNAQLEGLPFYYRNGKPFCKLHAR